jgi:carbonic anhydrase
MEKLIEGVEKFQREVYAPQREFFQSLITRQQPTALFITCSDSRINPNLLTQASPGELFILRNAGNIVPPHGSTLGGVAATLEYAVAVLKVKHIILCGHTHCGAMKAMLHREELKSLRAVAQWLGYAEAARRIVEENFGRLEEQSKWRAAIQENILVQLGHLRTHPSVAARLARSDLQLHGWLYKLESGEVLTYDSQLRAFVPLTANPEDTASQETLVSPAHR